jgi:hypothetical protein
MQTERTGRNILKFEEDVSIFKKKILSACNVSAQKS